MYKRQLVEPVAPPPAELPPLIISYSVILNILLLGELSTTGFAVSTLVASSFSANKTYFLVPTPPPPTTTASTLVLLPTVLQPFLKVNKLLFDATSYVKAGPVPPICVAATVMVLFTTYPLPPVRVFTVTVLFALLAIAIENVAPVPDP